MKDVYKNTLLAAGDMLGIPSILRTLEKKQPTVFLYHGVAPTPHNSGIFNYRKKFISPEAFRTHITWLKENYTILPLSTLIEHLLQQKGFPDRACAITFDDGYENVFSHAFPILRELRVPASVFLTTGFMDNHTPLWVDALEFAIGSTKKSAIAVSLQNTERTFPLQTYEERILADASIRSHMKSIPNNARKETLATIISQTECDLSPVLSSSPYQALSWEQCKSMQSADIEFGAHTLTHPILSSIPAGEAEKEIASSHTRIKEQLGTVLSTFAYPNGQKNDFTDETIALLKNLGITASVTTISGKLNTKTDPFRIPRITLDGTDDPRIFRMTASGARNQLRSLLNLRK